MAVITVSVASVRALKHALHKFLPVVKSSHMSEGIAAALGFKTNIALSSELARFPEGWTAPLSEPLFQARLSHLGYQRIPMFSFDDLVGGAGRPAEYLRLVERLAKFEEKPGMYAEELAALRLQASALFAKHWNLGYAEPRDAAKNAVLRIEQGVDHKACRRGWGAWFEEGRARLDFPGTDHAVRFYEQLPLSDGKYVECCTGLASMPYLDAPQRDKDQADAIALADLMGWERAELKGWSWHAAQETTLILCRRASTPSELRRDWESSFKRWAIEKKIRLLRGADLARRAALDIAATCQHFPLAVTSYEELNEVYLQEARPAMFFWPDDPVADALRKLFDQWTAEHAAADRPRPARAIRPRVSSTYRFDSVL